MLAGGVRLLEFVAHRFQPLFELRKRKG